MTNPSSPDAELLLAVSLGASIIAYRPVVQADGMSASWHEIDGDASFSLVTNLDYRLRLRVVAQDPNGNPIADPAWMVRAYTSVGQGSWQAIADADTAPSHFLTQYAQVGTSVRRYRFTVEIPNSGIGSTFEVSVRQRQPGASTGPDVLLDDGDFGPPPPNNQGDTPSPALVAGNLSAPV